jgi:hypothetical protein
MGFCPITGNTEVSGSRVEMSVLPTTRTLLNFETKDPLQRLISRGSVPETLVG